MDPLPAQIVTVPFIIALTQVAKALGLPARWGAVAAMGLGLTLSLAAELTNLFGGQNLYLAIVQGIAMGLSAAGLYSVSRAAAPKLGAMATGRPNLTPRG